MTDGAPQETEAQKKLRELKTQRAALVAAREAGEASRAEAREIEEAERALRDEQALNDAIEKYGDVGVQIAVVETSLGNVILKRASAMKFRRFQDASPITTHDVETLVRPCVVHPSLAEFDIIMHDLPAVLQRLGSAVIALAGQKSEELAKKS